MNITPHEAISEELQAKIDNLREEVIKSGLKIWITFKDKSGDSCGGIIANNDHLRIIK